MTEHEPASAAPLDRPTASPRSVDDVLELYRTRGHRRYGERVTQLEHALQTAWVASTLGRAAIGADRDGSDDDLVAAALLHDVAHLLEPEDDGGVDLGHETAGAAVLARWFGPAITEPVRLHVEAKRYLCATDPAYTGRLSAASVRSLALQGGPMGTDEVSRFEAAEHAARAISLRRCDDDGKVPDATMPGLEHYRPLLLALARDGDRSA